MKFTGKTAPQLVNSLTHIIKNSDVFNFYVLPLLGFGFSPHVIIPIGVTICPGVPAKCSNV